MPITLMRCYHNLVNHHRRGRYHISASGTIRPIMAHPFLSNRRRKTLRFCLLAIVSPLRIIWPLIVRSFVIYQKSSPKSVLNGAPSCWGSSNGSCPCRILKTLSTPWALMRGNPRGVECRGKSANRQGVQRREFRLASAHHNLRLREHRAEPAQSVQRRCASGKER